MVDTASLKLERGYLKASLTKLKTYADNVPPNKTIEDIEIRLEKLEEIIVDFKRVDRALAIAEVDSEYDAIEDKYMEVKSKLRACLNAKRREAAQNDSDTLPNFETTVKTLIEQQSALMGGLANSTMISQQNATPQRVRLPKIELPTFTGDYKDWPSFKDLFTSCVSSRTDLSNATKLQFLKGALKGEAAAVIRHLEITDSNFTEAWNQLLSRYDKKRQIISAYVKTFMNQPAVSGTGHGIATSLRKLADTSDQVVRGIDVQGTSAKSRDIWLIHIILNKLDLETKQEWADKASSENFPTFKSLIEFLHKRCDALETCEVVKRSNANHQVKSLHITTAVCVKCNQNHQLSKCPEYKVLTVPDKRKLVEQNALCYNCLSTGHTAQKCKSKHKCHYCQKLHHSSLHITEHTQPRLTTHHISIQRESAPHEQLFQSYPITSASSNTQVNSTSASHLEAHALVRDTNAEFTLLPTVLALAVDATGRTQPCRLLLDSGSQASFISEDCVRRLGLQADGTRFPIRGLSSTNIVKTKGRVAISLISRISSDIILRISAHVLNKLTSLQPSQSFNFAHWDSLDGYELADPAFHKSQKIDLIIGVDYFFHIFQGDQIQISHHLPLLQKTIFGYVVAGQLHTSLNLTDTLSLQLNITDIAETLQKFWEIEELPDEKQFTEEEQLCETFFSETHSVDPETSRYMVRLPVKQNSAKLGQSLHTAKSCFNALERKFIRNEHLHNEYKTFMEEYAALGHMEPIPSDVLNTNYEHFYLPHHAVIKPTSTTTKVRVVFNGSSPTTTGVSLNQKLMVGPKTQRDLIHILLSFRTFKIAMVADIEKMYRQVLIHPDDRTYQRIVWRETPSQPLQHLQLTTVTYGTSSAPFLATRALKQLTIEFANKYPLAENAINNHFYVDDFLGGAKNDDEALKLYEELTQLLKKRGFSLRKWASNSEQFLERVSHELKDDNAIQLSNQDGCIKLLGLKWVPKNDYFSFDVTIAPTIIPTKRNILSESSKIFDPLGFISPVTILFKIILQQLWLKKVEWDECSTEISQLWTSIQQELHHLHHVRIPRYINTDHTKVQFHGFADASESAYGAVIYCRSVDTTGEVSVRLVTAKAKVTPIKQKSIPRLELCAALLLAKLFSFVQSNMKVSINNCFAWTDSAVVLSWLSSHPRKWKSFVSNRTSIILSILPRSQWNHVQSSHNPADLASRGMKPEKLLKSDLWWCGPMWLQGDWISYSRKHEPNEKTGGTEIEEEKRLKYVTSLHVTIQNDILSSLFQKHSKLKRILRVLGTCFQFIRNCKKSSSSNPTRKGLIAADITRAYRCLISWTQIETFAQEINCLKTNASIHSSSRLLSLSPFIDEFGLLRVGGRLGHSCLSYEMKHPLVLPKDHIFVKYLIRHLHQEHLHAGPTLLISILRQQYWILSCRSAVKSTINKCVTCIKHRGITSQQLMAHLPRHRVGVYQAFENVGIDYAGPLQLLIRRGRGAKLTKGYIVLFVCFSTRAIHLEVAGDLSSETFLACLKRFTSRRGLPAVFYTDNGTNFVGAHKHLNNIYDSIESFYQTDLISDFISSNRIKWEFNPPSAPHFGGLWEAGVKAVKSILRRVIGDAHLTYEEMTTLLVQIEGLLNSRPLQPTSSDASSLDALTPAHFLIGHPITLLPEPPSTKKFCLQERWRLIQNMHSSFWKRWTFEYLSMMQQRPKWQKVTSNLQVGDMVVVKEKNIPPGTWVLGRVISTHQGSDGLVRVVTIRTSSGTFDRPCNKLVELPMHTDG